MSDDSKSSQGKQSGFRSLLGYHPRVWRKDYAEIELAIGPRHINSIGMVHGGVYATLLDAALSWAIAYCDVPGNVRYCTTVSLTTTFLKGTVSGTIVATGHMEAIEGRVATASGQVTDEAGTVLALGQATFLFFPGSERPEGVPKKKGE